MRAKIIIACNCANNYAPHCGAMITSVFENNKSNIIEINILTDGFSYENIDKFQKLASTYNQVIKIHTIPPSVFLPFSKISGIDFPIIVYYRLMIPKMFYQLDKILYLDIDIIVLKDLSELWNTQMNNCAISAVEDMKSTINESCARLDLPNHFSYFNAGVLLFNIKETCTLFEDAINIVSSNVYNLKYQDQDIINILYHNKINPISVKWNMMIHCFLTPKEIVDTQIPESQHWLDNPSIIHYGSSLKPWYYECKHPYKKEYWNYLSISPWAEMKPIHIYDGLFSFLYFIILSIKFHFSKGK